VGGWIEEGTTDSSLRVFPEGTLLHEGLIVAEIVDSNLLLLSNPRRNVSSCGGLSMQLGLGKLA